jgi:hypothetical protein
LTLEAVTSHHPISRIVSRGFISFDVSDIMLEFRYQAGTLAAFTV